MSRDRLTIPGWLPPLLLTLLALFAVAPFLRPGYFWGAHDARHDVYFLLEYDRAVQEGKWLVHWCPDFAFGQGYPFFLVYGPLATFLAELFHHFAGFGLTTSVKTVFALAAVGSALSMYFFVQSWAGERAAFVAGLLYLFVPYHLVDLYVRAAMAESLSFVFMPLVLWAALEAVRRPGWKPIVLGALAYASLMITSNLVVVLFTPLLAAYLAVVILLRTNEEMPFGGLSRQSVFPLAGELLHLAIPPALMLLLGLGLSAFFWLPALTEFKYVSVRQWYGGYYDFHKSFIYWYQLFSPHWGYGISVPGPDDDLSFQLGIVPFALSAASIYFARKLDGWHRWTVALFLATTAAAAFLTLGASAWAWEHVPGVRFAQFPWRYLILTTLAMPIAASGVLASAKRGAETWAVALFLGGLVILGSAPYLRVEIVPPPKDSGTLAGLMRFERTANEMTGVSVAAKEVPRWSPLAALYVEGKNVTTKVNYGAIPPAGRKGPVLGVHSLAMGTDYEEVWYWAADDYQRIEFFFEYFPGWTAYILDPKTKQVQKVIRLTFDDVADPYGRISVPVPAGEHILLLKFEDTPVRKAGKAITLATVVLLLAFFVVRWRTVQS